MPTVTSNTFQATVSTGIEPADYYVNGTSGNDANDGTTPAKAVQTLQTAIGLMSPGDILEIAGGDYRGWAERWANSIPDGTAENYTVIRGAAGETVRFLMAVNGTRRPLDLGGDPSDPANTKSYIEFNNITCDQEGTNSAYGDAAKVTAQPHHLRFIDCTFKNAWTQCLAIFDSSAYLPLRSLGNHYIDGCTFENSGLINPGTALYHGIYINHHDVTVTNCIFRNHRSGFGAQVYHSVTPYHADRLTFTKNICHGNRRAGLIFDGEDCLIANNIFYDNDSRGLSVWTYARRAKIYNNTISQTAGTAGIQLKANTDYIDVRNNIIYPAPATYFNESTGSNNTLDQNNFTTDPSYLNAAGDNYRLQASSPSGVKTGGVTFAEVTDDFDGNSRTVPYSIGAFEEDG